MKKPNPVCTGMWELTACYVEFIPWQPGSFRNETMGFSVLSFLSASLCIFVVFVEVLCVIKCLFLIDFCFFCVSYGCFASFFIFFFVCFLGDCFPPLHSDCFMCPCFVSLYNCFIVWCNISFSCGCFHQFSSQLLFLAPFGLLCVCVFVLIPLIYWEETQTDAPTQSPLTSWVCGSVPCMPVQ